MDNPPFDMVIDKQTLKIRKEGVSLTVTDDIKIPVVGIVLARRIVSEERNAHIGIRSTLSDRLHHGKQHGNHQADRIQKPSHLNVIYGMDAPT